MKVIIDRIEGKYAVVELEDGNAVDMPVLLLPEGAKEGDTIEITVNSGDTRKRKERIEEMVEDLWE